MGTKQQLKTADRKVHDEQTRLTESVLGARFRSVDVYRTIFDTIRVRIVDPQFHDKNRVRRDKLVLPLIHGLPDEIQTQIIFLLLLAPGEEDSSILNFEFDNPDHKLD